MGLPVGQKGAMIKPPPSDPAFLPVTHACGTTRAIAHRFTPASAKTDGPVLVFLPGYMSDMAGSKATALFEWAKAHGHACLCLD